MSVPYLEVFECSLSSSCMGTRENGYILRRIGNCQQNNGKKKHEHWSIWIQNEKWKEQTTQFHRLSLRDERGK